MGVGDEVYLSFGLFFLLQDGKKKRQVREEEMQRDAPHEMRVWIHAPSLIL
jgi:hypothetical protein